MILDVDFYNRVYFKEIGDFLVKNTPVRCNSLALLYVTSGEIKVEINYLVYQVKPNSLLMVTPLDIVTIKGHTGDYKAFLLSVPFSLFSPNMMVHDFSFFEKLKCQPVTMLFGKEKEITDRIFSLLDVMERDFEYEEFKNVAVSSIMMLLQVYRTHYVRHEGYTNNGKLFESRKKTLFRKFVKELIASHSKSREVLYYANELGVSSGYLNEVCNEVSNYSAKDIIDTAVSSRLKYELSYTDKSIQELADEYNFPSQSYLSRYYKRVTGLSPSEFRKKREEGE